MLAEARISGNIESSRKEYHRGDHSADNGFKRKSGEFSRIRVEVLAVHAEDVVDDKEYRLTSKEIVIEQSHEGDAQCEPALFTAVDVFLHSDEGKREEGGNVLKVVEEDVVYLEAGESVEQSACKSGIL